MTTTLAELAAGLGRIDLGTVQRRALDDAANRIEEAVRTALSHSSGGEHDAPWLENGDLRDSIAHEVDETQAIIGSTSNVAFYQEFGTRRAPPRPFLAPSAAELGQPVAEAIAKAVASVIRTATVNEASVGRE